MVDMVVHRHELKPTIARLCRVLMRAEPAVVGLSASHEPLAEAAQ